MDEYKPLHKSNLLLKDLGDEFLIYSVEHKELHVINPTARVIWDLCDGEHSISDMEKVLLANYAVPADSDIITDINTAINAFQQKGLLESESDQEHSNDIKI